MCARARDYSIVDFLPWFVVVVVFFPIEWIGRARAKRPFIDVPIDDDADDNDDDDDGKGAKQQQQY